MDAKLVGKKYPLHRPFAEVYKAVSGKTMLDERKLQVLYELALKVEDLPGDVAEAGVYKGGVIYLLASVLTEKRIHGFDSWEGLREPTEEDLIDGEIPLGMAATWGACGCPSEFLSCFGDRVVLHKGWFQHTFSRVAGEKFCLVHVDCDRYVSTRQSLEFFVPRMVHGGYMVFDDYGFQYTPGVTKAVDHFFAGYAGDFEYSAWANAIIKFQ